MKRSPLIVAAMLAAIAGSVLAQNVVEGFTESTDPAKAAAVERHAAELRSRAEATPTTNQVQRPTRIGRAKMRRANTLAKK